MIKQLLLRQMINETLLIFDIILLVILTRYLVVQGRSYASRFSQPHMQGAMALTIMFLGHAIVRGWSLATFISIRHGDGIFDLENAYPMALGGTVIIIAGLCWLIRIFAPSEWGEKVWVLSLVLTLVFIGLMRLVS